MHDASVASRHLSSQIDVLTQFLLGTLYSRSHDDTANPTSLFGDVFGVRNN